MFGMRGYSHSCGSYWAAGRHGHRGFGPGFGWGRGRGPGGGDMFRIGRLFAQGDLKLLALALIAEQPRHGYEIIKLIEEKTSGWYSPSPGVVYPTLTMREEMGYAQASQDPQGRKLYGLTPEGEKVLADNKAQIDAIFARFGGGILLSILNGGIAAIAGTPSTQISIGSPAAAAGAAASAAIPTSTDIPPTVSVKQGAAINPLLIVKILMGHEHIETTDRYLRAVAIDTHALSEVLDTLLAEKH